MEKRFNLQGYEIFYHELLEPFFGEDKDKVTFLSKGYEEIHLVIKWVNNELKFYPRFNVRVDYLGHDCFYIGINYNPETKEDIYE